MAFSLNPSENGRFLMSDQPIQRGSVKVTFVGGTVTVKDLHETIWENVPYEDIFDGATGNPFPSMADLIAWFDENCYEA